MRIHPREQNVNLTETKVRQAVEDIVYSEDADLTYGELIRVVSSAMSGVLMQAAKYMIREERHFDTDKLGGLE